MFLNDKKVSALSFTFFTKTLQNKRNFQRFLKDRKFFLGC